MIPYIKFYIYILYCWRYILQDRYLEVHLKDFLKSAYVVLSGLTSFPPWRFIPIYKPTRNIPWHLYLHSLANRVVITYGVSWKHMYTHLLFLSYKHFHSLGHKIIPVLWHSSNKVKKPVPTPRFKKYSPKFSSCISIVSFLYTQMTNSLRVCFV